MEYETLSNDSLKRTLARISNSLTLERLLSEEFERWRYFESNGHQWELGTTLHFKDTDPLFQEVKHDVNNLFDIVLPNNPGIETGSLETGVYYDGTIYLPRKEREVSLRELLAHEYTHFLTAQQLGISSKDTHGIFLEGLATAATASFGDRWSKRYQNDSYLRRSLHISELRQAYEWLYNQLGEQPARWLKEILGNRKVE